MNFNEEQVRAAIAEQAGEWLVASDEGSLDAQDAAALAAWLKTSPVHVEEFLGVSTVARDLRAARADPEYALDAILARARAEEDAPVRTLWLRVAAAFRGETSGPWLTAAVTIVVCGVLSLGWFLPWNVTPTGHPSVSSGTTALHFETRHGEQLSRRLADSSILHLDTDSAVTIRYGKNERLVLLTAGQADFDVVHDPDRAFRVIAGSAEVVDVGTKFDVRLQHDSTVVTVIEGRVAVAPSATMEELGMGSNRSHARRVVQLGANQQITVTEGEWPAPPLWRSTRSAPRPGCAEKSCLTTNRWSVSRPNTIVTPRSRSKSQHPHCGICKSAGSSPPTIPRHSLPFCAASRVCGSK
jgi:transmembrane sensor